MKVMMINPKVPVYLRVPSVPLGPISIASYLRSRGDEVKFIECGFKKVDIVKEIECFQPGVIGISCLSYMSSVEAKKLTAKIKSVTDAPVIWGGQAPSSLPEMYLKDGKPDYLSIGEGEITVYEFVRAIEHGGDVSKVPGLAYLDDEGNLVLTPERPVADLTTFPEMDWSFVTPQKYFSSFFHCTKMLYLHASKGCPALCTFCANKQFHQGRNRCRDPKHVMHDIEYLVGKCGANGIYFSDEQFMPNRKIRNELLQMIIESKLEFVWGCQTRLGVLTHEDIDFMYRAGCRWILFGIETGSQDMIRKIKKGTDLSLAKPTIEYCEKVGMTVQATFIIGFPNETVEQVRQTVDLALELPASLPAVNILFPLPNSEIFFEQLKTNPAFKSPQSIEEIAKLENKMTDIVWINISDVPDRDLYVIHHYFQWKDFIGKDSVNDDSFGIVKKMARDTLNRVFKHGIKGFFFGSYYSLRQFLIVFYYSHFFKKTLKKYGLKS